MFITNFCSPSKTLLSSIFRGIFGIFWNSIWDQLLNFTISLDSTIALDCLPFKIKKLETKKGFCWLCFYAFLPPKNPRANIDAEGVYCLIPALRFATAWPKIANKIVRNLIVGLQLTTSDNRKFYQNVVLFIFFGDRPRIANNSFNLVDHFNSLTYTNCVVRVQVLCSVFNEKRSIDLIL